MQDDKKPEFDDLDDFELDDFDLDDDDIELDDLDIEDLEKIEAGDVDIDDEAVSDSDDWDEAALSEPSGADAPQANKTLIYGILGVILIVVLFVAWQGLSSLLGSGNNAPQMVDASVEQENVQDSQSQDAVADVIDAPPMPMPMTNDAPDETAALIETPASDEASSLPAPALTPLPNFDDTGEMPSLPSLDSEEEVTAVFDEPAPAMMPASALPKIEEDHRLDQVVDIAPAQPAPAPAPVATEEIAPVIEEKSPIELPVVDNEQIQDLNDMMDEKSAVVEGQIVQIRKRLDDHDDAMAEIMASLQRIEAELKSQKADIKAVQEKAASAPAPKKAAVSIVKKSAPKKKVVKPNTKKPILYERSAEKAKSWVLKSAQPGKAIVAEAGTNYLRSVEVGASLPGLGKVTSISNASGRWIVQGTQGRITQ